MKRIVVAIILALSVAAGAQQSEKPPQVVTPKAPYDSAKAKIAVLTEENLQLKANAAQQAYQEQMKAWQGDWQAQEAIVVAWIAEVKKANGWDDTYTYDRVKDQWTHTPKGEVKKPADEPKK